jgi:hypothetical protein
MLGSTISNGVSGAAMGGPWGAAAGVALGIISNISSVFEAHANRLNEKLEKANEELKDAELDRATKKEEARTLASALDNLKKL